MQNSFPCITWEKRNLKENHQFVNVMTGTSATNILTEENLYRSYMLQKL